VTAVLVTGAAGFVGRAACTEFTKRGWSVRAAVRQRTDLPSTVEQCPVGDISAEPRWPLEGIEAVVHLAGIAHQLGGQNAESVYHAVNCQATERLASAAARAGVRRFVFMSSIKVNGERTPIDRPFRPEDRPDPQDRYARSKWAAEQALAQLARDTGMEVVVLRPPLVYGPGVRANFLRFVRLVERGLPLPFGAIHNRRSMVYVGNLVDLIGQAVTSAGAAGQTLMVSDGEDLSTPRLAMEIGRALSRQVKLLPVPVALLKLGGALTGLRVEIGRLVDSLAVDIAETRARLAWTPAVSTREGIERTVDWYRSLPAAR
jgi:nucleoside-diphosphate-sugar epimerase